MSRRAAAEFLGTGLLVAVVIGSGIAAERLTRDPGLRLLENAAATATGLYAVILMVGPVSGAHLNPVVSLADALLGRPAGTGLSVRELGAYLPAQLAGGICGAVVANLMYAEPAVSWASRRRTGGALWLSEAVATAGLLVVIFAVARSGRSSSAPAAVGAYIGAAYWFTSSTSFANPAVTVARTASDSFAGIAAVSAPGFVLAQLVGGALGVLAVWRLYPDSARVADEVVVPHPDLGAGRSEPSPASYGDLPPQPALPLRGRPADRASAESS